MARGDEETERKIIPPKSPETEAAGVQDAPGEDKGNLEAAQLGRGAPIRDLQKEAEEKEHDRDQKFRDQFEDIAIIALWALFIAFMLLAGVWLFHLLIPTGTKAYILGIGIGGWLTPPQFDKVEGILTGGIIAGLVADHFKRRMG